MIIATNNVSKNNMDANKMAFFAINHLESNNAQVRFAAYKVLLSLYS